MCLWFHICKMLVFSCSGSTKDNGNGYNVSLIKEMHAIA